LKCKILISPTEELLNQTLNGLDVIQINHCFCDGIKKIVEEQIKMNKKETTESWVVPPIVRFYIFYKEKET